MSRHPHSSSRGMCFRQRLQCRCSIQCVSQQLRMSRLDMRLTNFLPGKSLLHLRPQFMRQAPTPLENREMSVPINHPPAPAKSAAGSRAFSSAFVARTLAQARFMDSRKTGTAERCLTSPVCTPLSQRELVLDRLVQATHTDK